MILAELYVAAGTQAERDDMLGRVEEATRALASSGATIELLRSYSVEKDEICYLLFDTDSCDAVRAVGQRAGVVFERVSEAVEARPGRS